LLHGGDFLCLRLLSAGVTFYLGSIGIYPKTI
jgi:hypothetical protein